MKNKAFGLLIVFVGLLSGCAAKKIAPQPAELAQAVATVQPSQIVAYNFDWDDNAAFMPTKVTLFQKKTGTPREISLTTFNEVRAKLGKRGEWRDYQTGPQSFAAFVDAPAAPNQFLADLKAVVDRPLAPGSRPEWQGPSWSGFALALSRPETTRYTNLIVSRAQSAEHLLEGLRYLQEKGFLKHVPPAENIIVLGTPADGKALLAARTQALKSSLDRVQAVALSSGMTEVIAADGKATRKLHLWSATIDDFATFKALTKTLGGDLRKGRWSNVKIVLFYTGITNPTEAPRAVILKANGKTRSAKADEVDEAEKIACHATSPGLLTR